MIRRIKLWYREFIRVKFSVRVKYFMNGKYEVQWSEYRFIPTYRSLCFFFYQSPTSGTECWSTKLYTYQEAMDLASKLKSKEDIEDWYKPYELERESFLKRKEEYYKKSVPKQREVFKY